LLHKAQEAKNDALKETHKRSPEISREGHDGRPQIKQGGDKPYNQNHDSEHKS
jgi:hypothetical protein